MKVFRFSLIFAIITSLACLLGLTWILLSLISFKTAEKDLLAQKSEEGRVLLSSFVHLLPQDMTGVTTSAAAVLAERLSREPDFAGIAVFDSAMKPVYVLGDVRDADQGARDAVIRGMESGFVSADGRNMLRYAPVLSGNKITGAARLSLSLAGEHSRLKRSRHLFLVYFLLDSFLLVGVGSFLLSRAVVFPLTRLVSATKRISAGDYSHLVHVPGSVEVAELAEAFNRMLLNLREKESAVASHVASLEEANRELKQAREETIRSEKMASVGLLAAGMAHEIGTPLAAVIGYSGLLKDELKDDPEKVDYLRRIEEDCHRIDRMVRDLLDYARPATPRKEMIDLSVLVSENVELLQTQGALKQVEVSLSLAEGLPFLSGDPHQLRQLFVNLLINARDAMPTGGKLMVGSSLSKGDKGAFLRVDIADSGFGIPPEEIPKIFEPFFTTKDPGKGTGLGLAIVSRIVGEYNGRLEVESKVGEGTTFSVFLPVAGKSVKADGLKEG